MKFLIAVFVVIASFIFIGGNVVAQDQKVVLPPAGLTPESPFYFFERWDESLQEFFTFSQEGKVRLQVRFIAERTSEVKVMLEREEINKRAVETAFERMGNHRVRITERIEKMVVQNREVAVLSASIVNAIDPFDDILETILEEANERMEKVIELERQKIEQKLNEPAFAAAMEGVLREIAEKIDQEIGQPLEGFQVIEDEYNVDVEDDTYTATYRAEAPHLVDLELLKDRILAGGVAERWESGDVSLVGDSLDITFEKTYPAVTIEGVILFPEVSVTVSATQHSPEVGMTEINYDIDITLESESEYFLGFLEKQEEGFDDLTDELEEQMELQEAAERTIREAEEARQKVIDEATEEGVELPANVFAEFDGLLTQAKSVFAAGNFQEAKRLAEQAEKSLDDIQEAIEGLEEAKEKERELKEEKEWEVKEEVDEKMREGAEKEVERLEKEREKAEEKVREAEEKLREVGEIKQETETEIGEVEE